MKKTINKVLLIFIILSLFITGNVYASNFDFVELEYTEIYKEWQKLSDEEKKNKIEPRKYNLNSNKTNEEIMYSNKYIPLKSLLKGLKASIYSSNTKFSLQDLISHNLTIRDQKDTGWCWAFTTMSSLETNLALNNYLKNQNEKIYDYSEKHLVYSMTNSFLNGQINEKAFDIPASKGGNQFMSTAYLARGDGAINEEDLPFDNKQDPIDISNIQGKKVQTTVKDIKYFDGFYITEEGTLTLDGENATSTQLQTLQTEMKEHISTNGSIFASMYFPGLEDTERMDLKEGTVYTKIDSYEYIKTHVPIQDGIVPNHAVSIIGWDDNFDKTKFSTQPKNNGAWIIRNSYGIKTEQDFNEVRQIYPQYTDDQIIQLLKKIMNCSLSEDGNTLFIEMGDNGIFYVSYEDAYLYSDLMGIEKAKDTVDYDNIYQYDYLGGTDAYKFENSDSKDIYIANVFERTKSNDEYLTSIGYTTLVSGTYEVYVNSTDSEKSSSKFQKAQLTVGDSISLSPGYHTIELSTPIKLTGESYVIAICCKHGENSCFAVENPEYNEKITLSKEGESFATIEGFSSDSDWIDIGNPDDERYYMGNVCIKGIVLNNYNGIPQEDPNQNPNTDPDSEPSSNPNQNPNTDPTSEPSSEPNTDPTSESSSDPNQNPNTDPTSEPSSDPNTDPTSEPNSDPNQNPNTDPDSEPSSNPNQNPNSDPNSNKDIAKNSNYSSANAVVKNIKITENEESVLFEITGIKVTENMDKYDQYYYLSSDSKATNISEDKWNKVESFSKQSDGTYKLTFKVTKESQFEDVEEGKDLYIYIKEIATKGNNVSEIITSGILLTVGTEGIDIIGEDGEKIITLHPEQEDNTKSSENLPNTGMKTIVIITVLVGAIVVINYVKYRKLKDVI